MKRREVYRLLPKLKGTEEERIISKEINYSLSKNYIELGLNGNFIRYLDRTEDSLLLITCGKDICKDYYVEIQMIPQKTTIPKELSDLLTSKGFVRIQK